jgi:hypothetical protein
MACALNLIGVLAGATLSSIKFSLPNRLLMLLDAVAV